MAQKRHGMSREEAGRKGGKAPHSCRGAECNQKQSQSKSKSRSSKSSNNKNEDSSWF